MFTQSKSKPNTEERSKLWCHKWFHAIKCLLRHLGKAMYPIAMQLVCPCMSARPRGVRSYCADRRRLLSLTERGTALVSAFPTEEERRVSGNMKTKTEELWLTNGVNSVHLVSRGAIINKKHSHTPSLFFGFNQRKNEWNSATEAERPFQFKAEKPSLIHWFRYKSKERMPRRSSY